MSAAISGWTGRSDRLGGLEDPEHALVEDRAGVDDDRVIPLEQRAEDVLDMVGRDELRGLGRLRCGQDVETAVVADRVGAQQFRLAEGGLVAHDIGDGELRLEVQVRGHATELEVEVDEDDPVGLALRGDDGDVRGDRRRADSALRAVHRDGPSRAGKRQAVRRHDRREVARALEAQQECLDPGLDLAGIERARDDVVCAGLEEADPLLDVVGRRDAQDRHGRHGRRRPDLAAEVEAGLLP